MNDPRSAHDRGSLDSIGDIQGTAGHGPQVVAGARVVDVVYGSPAGLTPIGNQPWSQDTLGIAGVAQPHAGFGASLASGEKARVPVP